MRKQMTQCTPEHPVPLVHERGHTELLFPILHAKRSAGK